MCHLKKNRLLKISILTYVILQNNCNYAAGTVFACSRVCHMKYILLISLSISTDSENHVSYWNYHGSFTWRYCPFKQNRFRRGLTFLWYKQLGYCWWSCLVQLAPRYTSKAAEKFPLSLLESYGRSIYEIENSESATISSQQYFS